MPSVAVGPARQFSRNASLESRARCLRMRTGSKAKNVVITGAGANGIGGETARGLVRTLPDLERIVLCVRDVEKGELVAGPLRNGAVVGKTVDVRVVPVQLGNLESTRECAKAVNEIIGDAPLDLLVCNAGVMACPLMYTEDTGNELEYQYGVNFVSHAMLTNELLPALRREEGGRVVFVSSLAVAIARGRKEPPLISEKRKAAVNETNYSTWGAYGDSKLAMSMFARALAQREECVESVSLHPGIVQTELQRHILPAPLYNLTQTTGWSKRLSLGLGSLLGLKTPTQGAELSIELCNSAPGTLTDGALYVRTGGEQIADNLAPLLSNDVACDSLFEDTMKFLHTI